MSNTGDTFESTITTSQYSAVAKDGATVSLRGFAVGLPGAAIINQDPHAPGVVAIVEKRLPDRDGTGFHTERLALNEATLYEMAVALEKTDPPVAAAMHRTLGHMHDMMAKSPDSTAGLQVIHSAYDFEIDGRTGPRPNQRDPGSRASAFLGLAAGPASGKSENPEEPRVLALFESTVTDADGTGYHTERYAFDAAEFFQVMQLFFGSEPSQWPPALQELNEAAAKGRDSVSSLQVISHPNDFVRDAPETPAEKSIDASKATATPAIAAPPSP